MKIIEQLNKIIKSGKSFFLLVVSHLFLSFFVVFIIALAVSGFFYYKYGFVAENKKIENPPSPFELNEKTYQEVLKVWQEKEKVFNMADDKDYPNVFEELSQED